MSQFPVYFSVRSCMYAGWNTFVCADVWSMEQTMTSSGEIPIEDENW